ncbi:MAG: ABC transporter ATP-binding protein [Oscillospiraceae bacterium]
MRLIFHYMRKYARKITLSMFLKLLGAIGALLLPYILEHLVDNVVPRGEIGPVYFWGTMMVLSAVFVWRINVSSNTISIDNAHNVSYDVRRDLFNKTANLSGAQFDSFGLPSLTSRMTSDSYNVQSFVQSFQMLCVRAPTMLIGGVIITMTMDWALSLILCVMLPILLAVVIIVSRKGIPLYHRVQERLDDVVRVMRENITGIRVVKALSKTEYEKRRFSDYNDKMTTSDIKASTFMAVPGPFMQLCLNVGLTLVVFIGARRVNGGLMKPGVIMAFLTYFNQIMQSVMALNRMFMMISKASASADRIAAVLAVEEDQQVLPLDDGAQDPDEDAFIEFRHVNFSYNQKAPLTVSGSSPADTDFTGGEPEQCLYDIDFKIKRGESLGIIGPTGCGKTTIINLLMRFYDVEDGAVFVDGRDVRTYDKDELHRKFGVVFQNDLIFNDTLRENISFGRDLTDDKIHAAARDAMAADFIEELDDGLDYVADIKGANLSGGQKQRILISRALAADPEILVLDDSSSALDYKTDAALRKAIFEHHSDSTTIMIAQRVSSVQSLKNILVMDNGHCIGYGSHKELLESCPEYREIFETQMGSMV